jgi:ABC-type siderophore export system fused ATPase/permease subunit
VRGKPGNRSLYLIGGILFLSLIGVALVFVTILKPADNEYNNTIPAVMGVLTILSTATASLVGMLNMNAKHRENIEHIEKIEKSEPATSDTETPDA